MTHPVVADVAERLTAAGWTVRKLRDKGFGATAAQALLAKGNTDPSLATLERALSLLQPPRRLWHGKA